MAIPPAAEIVDYARRLGVRRAVLRGAYVLANRTIALSIFDCVRLAPEHVNAALAESDDGVESRFLEPDAVDGLASVLDPRAARIVRGALARGDDCYAVFDDGQLANVGFYASRPTPIVNDLVVHFDARYRYMHGAFTPEAYRGRRLHALGVLRAARALFDRGIPELVGVYERTNYRSMVSARRMGWTWCGTLYRVGGGRWMRLGRTAAARAIGMWLEPRRSENSP
jgi:hypothetical protein